MILELPLHPSQTGKTDCLETRAPVRDPVVNLMLYVDMDCNLRCDYCFVNKEPRAMSWDTARKSVDFLRHRAISQGGPWAEISFFGGEPFLQLELLERTVAYAKKVRQPRITFAATTNGTIANERVEKLVRQAPLKLLISLDGDAYASRARPFLGGRPSYPAVARNLRKLVAWAQWSSVRMTFTSESLDLVANVQHALSLGARSVLLAPVTESDWSGKGEALEEAYHQLGEWFLAECRAGRLPPLEVTWALLRQWHHVREGGAAPSRPCSIARELLAVDVDGNVMPCHRFLYRPADWLGTIDNPAQLSSERGRYAHLRSEQILGCDTCQARPVCGGGCRLTALEAGLGLYGAHPSHCLVMRAQARMVYRLYEALASEANPVFEKTLRLKGALAASCAYTWK